MRISPLRLGLAGGILCGIAMMVTTLLAVHTNYNQDAMLALEQVYPGYHVTDAGSFIGLFYGFIDGFVSLAIFAWLYNILGCCCKCSRDSACDTKYNAMQCETKNADMKCEIKNKNNEIQ